MSIADSPVSSERLGELLDLLRDGIISSRIAKDVFAVMVNEGKNATSIVEERGLKQITDTTEIESTVDKVINNNPKQVEEYKSGNEKISGWFVGQVACCP